MEVESEAKPAFREQDLPFESQGAFTLGKSSSSLCLVRTKIQCIIFGLVRFLFPL